MRYPVPNTGSSRILSAALYMRLLRLPGLTFQMKILRFRVERGRSPAQLLCCPLAFITLPSFPRLCPKEEPEAQGGKLSGLSGTARKR